MKAVSPHNGAGRGRRASRMPAVFIGHGNPMNALEDNAYTRAWRELGRLLPRPEAILSISAHWLTEGTYVHEGSRPRTIHDFWGFPEDLNQLVYPCPGSPEWARELRLAVGSVQIEPDSTWGLDHGTWVPLLSLFPDAEVPVFQLSIDLTKPVGFHYRLGKELSALRDMGVLILGSGNIVHNLSLARFPGNSKPYSWALEFEDISRRLIAEGDHEALISYERLGKAASLSIPTLDHYWPLFYVLAQQREGEVPAFPVTGIAHSSVSMMAVAIGL